MWRHVDFVWTDVSEERIASIFRVEKSASEEPGWAGDEEGGDTSQKKAFFIVTAVKPSNLTESYGLFTADLALTFSTCRVLN
jgi:hypothetical protein